jgi:predicted O-methyltransferase YrrM
MKGLPITEQLYDYIVDTFAREDALLHKLPAEAKAQGIPLINISPEQGKLMQLLMRANNTQRAIEVGSLFGYSAIWIARALPAGGKLYTLELNPKHARVTRENVARAGLSDKVEVIEGDARKTLPALAQHAPFDFAFVDAEKEQYVDYYEQVMTMLRPGAVLVADNASASGLVWNANPPAESRERVVTIRAFNQRMAGDPRLTALLLPVGDGMCVGVVV